MKRLRVAIAGFGIVGKRRFNCLKKINFIDVVAVCDRNNSENYNLKKGTSFHNNYKELFRYNLDIIFICMTNDIAPIVTLASLKNNLNVFCEKPPGRFLSDIKKIYSYQKRYKSKLKLMYGFNHRFHDSIIEAKKIIKNKTLGKIINLNGVYGKSKLITFNQPTWRTSRKIAGGGVLLDQGIHMVDLIRFFAGDFHEVKSFVSNNFWKFDIEDNAYALLKSKLGIYAILNSSATQWRHKFRIDINLTKGNLILEGILTSSKSYGKESLTIVKADPKSDVSEPKITTKKYFKDLSWDREINYFIKCVRNNLVNKKSTSLDALRTMELVNKIYYSDKVWRKKYNIKK